MLVTFPEGYRLYEHVKKTERDGNTEVKAKTHAAGGNDRQDAYLYGHPAGKRKRFRSPADFFPHLLWLCTDESGDPDNCGCKICSPEELENVIPGAKTPKVKPEQDIKIAPGGVVKIKQEPKVQRPSSTGPPAQALAQPLPQPRSMDQQIDQRYNTFIYRPGELVWFQRGQAWGLGVVLRRWSTQLNERRYSVQPLSQPFNHSPPVIKALDAEMRPWLAWSVPRYTIAIHNQQAPTFDTTDWRGVSQRYNAPDVEVDASIMAAKHIDSTYTLFSPLATKELPPGITEIEYNGIFIGGEKIWLGDPLRIVPGSGTDIFVPRSIKERKQRAGPNTTTSVSLVGDVYTLQQTSHSNPSVPTPAAPRNNPNLPPRLTEDLAVRNARSILLKHIASYWRLLHTNTRIELNDIKGRWYEASVVMPILHPDKYKQMHSQGDVTELGCWMNARGDCKPGTLPSGARAENIRVETRRDALGQAVPAQARIQDGFDSLPENIDPALAATGGQAPHLNNSSSGLEIDPRFETADSSNNSSDEIRVTQVNRSTHDSLAGPETAGEGSFEDFMNLDAEEDVTAMEGVQPHSQMPGFGAEYDSSQAYY